MTTTTKPYPETPMLDKMGKAREALGTEHIGEFLEWLNDQGVRLCRWRTDLTAWQPCLGVSRRGTPVETFSLEDPNCREGRVVREVRYPRDGSVVTVPAGDVCPVCAGDGGREVEASEQWVEETKSIQDLLAEYADVDLQEVERERRAVLTWVREQG